MTSKKCPVWNVYMETGYGKIKQSNVFEFGQFTAIVDDLKTIIKSYKKKFKECADDKGRRKLNGQMLKELRDELQSDLRYYFWAKCEYEVLVSEWPVHPDVKTGEKTIESMCMEHGKDWYKTRENVYKVYDSMSSDSTIKIDVYQQIMMNYDPFERIVLDYVGYKEM